LIGTAAALARLNDQQVGWLTISGGGSGPARDVASGSAADGSVGSGDTSGTAPPEMMPSSGAPQATAGTTAHAPGPADRAPEPPPPSGASEGCPDPVPDVKVPNPGPDVPVASGTDPSIAPDTPCVPITVHTEPTRVTVTLTGVANDLSTVSDQAGNVWILPAYTFHDGSGATYTVLSVADRYLDLATG
jgi:hypothetical protein